MTDNRLFLPFPAFGAICIFALLMIIGCAIIPRLSIQLQPTDKSNSINIKFNWPETSSVVVERDVTSKIEGLLGTVRGIKNIKSISSKNTGSVNAEVDAVVNQDVVRYQVSLLMRHLYPNLPSGVSYPVTTVEESRNDALNTIMTYSLISRESNVSLKKVLDNQIIPILDQIEGIYKINIYGVDGLMIKLTYNQPTLNKLGIKVADITQCISDHYKTFELSAPVQNSRSHTMGFADRISLSANKINENLMQLPVKIINSRLIRLADIASIAILEQARKSDYRINGLNTVNVEIIATKHINTLSLARRIRERLNSAVVNFPANMRLVLTHDVSKKISQEIKTIIKRAFITIVLLIIVLSYISGQKMFWILLLIATVSNILLSFILFYLFNIEIHIYSLAALTISLGIVIDNAIVVIDHLHIKKNLNILLAVLGTSANIIGSAFVIFLLDETQRVNLIDFVLVIVINLVVSIGVSLLLIPSLFDQMVYIQRDKRKSAANKKNLLRVTNLYAGSLRFLSRFRFTVMIILFLSFGLPTSLLPQKLESETTSAGIYNYTFGSSFYNDYLRNGVNLIFGGSLNLFLSRYEPFDPTNEKDAQTELRIDIRMPKEVQMEQMNALVYNWENQIKDQPGVAMFRSRINSGSNAEITVEFTKTSESGPLPVQLKKVLEKKALMAGVAEFNISGAGKGFSNNSNAAVNKYAIKLTGYDYTILKDYAVELKGIVAANPRVSAIDINGERGWQSSYDNDNYVVDLKKGERLSMQGFSQSSLNRSLQNFSSSDRSLMIIPSQYGYLPLFIQNTSGAKSLWSLMNHPIDDSENSVRLDLVGKIGKESFGERIVKENQQFQLFVNFDFIGDFQLADDVAQDIIKRFNKQLPLGYHAASSAYNYGQVSAANLLMIVAAAILIVFIISAVFLNSIIQAISVTLLIPMSYIGIFLMTYFFDFKFDEGGYSAFVMLCGVSTSGALYILNDFNILIRSINHQGTYAMLYLKAVKSKIIPVFLSRLSILISLIPFVFWGAHAFWFSLSLSLIGGVITSLLGLFFIFPLMLKQDRVFIWRHPQRIKHG